MKAVIFRQYGGPGELHVEDVPDPSPGVGEVVVKVEAAALNHIDLYALHGTLRAPLPHIPGAEAAGTISQMGPGVEGLSVGQRVAVLPWIACERPGCHWCLSGEENVCPDLKVRGIQVDGTFAEYVKVRAFDLFPLWESISSEDAAAIPLVFGTAWNLAVTRGRLQPGETALVLAAASGVGSALIQIAKLFGARVIAAAGSDEKLARARQLGADETINYSNEPISETVRGLTGGHGVELVADLVGSKTWGESVASLARKGRLMAVASTTGADISMNLRYLFTNHLQIIGIYGGSKADLWQVFRFVREGKLRPVVDRTFDFSQAAAAYQLMEDRGQVGKILLRPDGV